MIMAGNTTQKLAVLIGAENARPSMYGKALLAEVAKYGIAHVKRAYGNWTSPNLSGWKEELLRQSIQPIQQFPYTHGKNATDSAMIKDAMDLLYQARRLEDAEHMKVLCIFLVKSRNLKRLKPIVSWHFMNSHIPAWIDQIDGEADSISPWAKVVHGDATASIF